MGRTSIIYQQMTMMVRRYAMLFLNSLTIILVSGQDTLHGGIYGWDRRNWTIVSKSSTSVTYRHFDPADEGFPGNVTVYVSLKDGTSSPLAERFVTDYAFCRERWSPENQLAG